MFTPVPGVAAAPPAYGLVASAARPDIPRWEQGLAWIPERCGTAYQLLPACGDAPGGYTPPRPGAAYYQPVGMRIADQCTTLGGPVDEERVRRVAEAQAPYIVARELWSGTLTQTDPYTFGGDTYNNAYLASSAATTVGGTAAAPLVALGRLEQAALEASHGQPVMLHVPPAAAWQLAVALTRVGQSWLTTAGSVVVADAGYPGTGPAGQAAGATVWAYATAPVAVLMTPWQLDLADQTTVDRATNTRTVWAQRLFAATFDPCLLLATEITL